MMSFENKYKQIVNSIIGDNENKLSYHEGYKDEQWSISAINNTMCSLGEVEGEIEVSGSTLEEVILAFKKAVDEHNAKMEG